MTEVGEDGREITLDLLSVGVPASGLEVEAGGGSTGGAEARRAPPLALGVAPPARLTGANPEPPLRSSWRWELSKVMV